MAQAVLAGTSAAEGGGVAPGAARGLTGVLARPLTYAMRMGTDGM